MNIGEKIKKLRIQSQMTQKDLSEKIGCAAITIRQYESGKREPKLGVINRIADVLCVPMSAFLDDDLFASMDIPEVEQMDLIDKKIARITNDPTIPDSKKNAMLTELSLELELLSNLHLQRANNTQGYLDAQEKKKTSTVAIHFDENEFTEEEIEDIKRFAEFIKSKRNDKEYRYKLVKQLKTVDDSDKNS